MKRCVIPVIIVSTWLALVGCSQQESNKTQQQFSASTAKENLSFAKDQYLKLIEHIENSRHLHPKPACIEDTNMVCVPRSEEHDGIYLEQAAKWTNGFYPGVLWKLLSSKEYINSWQDGQEQKLFDTASHFQQALISEAMRGNTHDLGFILYDSFGEALNYKELDANTKSHYLSTLQQGRETLATRYDQEVGLIKSWDWPPQMRMPILENGEQIIIKYDLANPWTFPVIVDNMMNLEYLLSSPEKSHHSIALSHANNTSINHYFYDESDQEQQYPLSYHVFDYGAHKPGNWQGVGNISAWARGQAWSLYGFVTVVEALEKKQVERHNYSEFKQHLNRLVGSVEYLLQDGVVPFWDFFAARDNAYEYAENISPDTAVFSGILGLCDLQVEAHIKPYNGYRPMSLATSMLSDNSVQQLQGKVNWHGEKIIQGDKLLPCGTKPYRNSHKKIPRDTSAAAIFASALYRYASFMDNHNERTRLVNLADKIMAELTNKYRTDRKENSRVNSYDLGFVLSAATGDMGRGGELDTPIVYGDFYFIEANIRKIELEQSKR